MNLTELIATGLGGTDQQVLDWLNEPVAETFENHINAKGLMAGVGAVMGATILDKLEAASVASSPIKWVMKSIDGGEGVDVGHAETRAMLDSLAGTVLAQPEVDAVKALGERSSPRWSQASDARHPVTLHEVSVARGV